MLVSSMAVILLGISEDICGGFSGEGGDKLWTGKTERQRNPPRFISPPPPHHHSPPPAIRWITNIADQNVEFSVGMSLKDETPQSVSDLMWVTSWNIKMVQKYKQIWVSDDGPIFWALRVCFIYLGYKRDNNLATCCKKLIKEIIILQHVAKTWAVLSDEGPISKLSVASPNRVWQTG